MAPLRAPGQGVANILRFNWPFFALGASLVLVFGLGATLSPAALRPWLLAAAAGTAVSTVVSLAASYYVYDRSPLYRLPWLDDLPIPPAGLLVNVHAGFDETSALLRARYPVAALRVFDFYDPARHTEASIRRARRAYPPYPGTEVVPTTRLPLPDAAADAVFVLFAAHEIRDPAERLEFFREIRRVLRPGGQFVVTEHLRDAPNFLAYNVGFFHFYPEAAWRAIFARADLRVAATVRTIPLVTTFILVPGAAAPR